MRSFEHEIKPARVIFGNGTLQSKLKEQVQRLGARHALVLSTGFQADLAQQAAKLLGEGDNAIKVSIYTNATMHTPIEVTEEAMRSMGDADCLIALGGGSTTGLSKAIALRRSGMPQIVVPTTYAGSEATPVVGQTENRKKTTVKSNDILPGTIIYDVGLTLTLPATMTCTSGINAIAHAVEGLYATDATPITDMFAVRGIRSMLTALETLQKTSQDDSQAILDARANALEASWLCGTVLGNVHMGLHHKLCHTMGGMLNTPHAETHAILLPFTLLYNYGSLTAPQKACFGQAFDTQDGLAVAQRLRAALTNQPGVPLSLKDIGVTEEDLPKVAAQAASAPYPNPRPLLEDKLLLLLRSAWKGTLDASIQE